ncbi:MAG: hypothetical protein JW739_00845 [Opitutales bacterium]|nr:hypothetical protein [Opitutales bacterium]
MKLTQTVFWGLCSLANLPMFAAELHIVPVKEWFFTSWNHQENVDSPAVWNSEEGKRLLVSTAKSSHSLLVEDPENGHFITRIGGRGTALGQFDRPNGISIVADLCFVVERDNHRVQMLLLPDFRPLATFGEEDLVQPYGINVVGDAEGRYTVFVTDNREVEDSGIQDADELSGDETVPDELLSQRVRVYQVEVEGEHVATIDIELENTFGDLSTLGKLSIVESIYADPQNDRLLIADESMDTPGHNVKIYSMNGSFSGQTIGDGIYEGQAEGIALVPGAAADDGYWVLTDQGKRNNYFHVFDRKTLAYVGSFRGETTLNTDGCWFDATPTSRFPNGAFYAVHNDGCVAAFSWHEIEEALGL